MESSEAVVHPGAEPGRFWSALLFVRFSGIGFSLSLPLLGAGTVVAQPTAGEWIHLSLVAACYHVSIFVLNDVIDLDVDRTEPRRAGFPLVRGAISPGQALAFALAQVPLAFFVAMRMQATTVALAALAAAFGLGLIYNLWGKRTALPILTDAAQGLAWACLVVFGAVVSGGEAGWLTWIVSACIVLYVMLVNGIHGGVRDVRNDIARGVHSTAILLGAREDDAGRVRFPFLLRAWALGLHCLLFMLALLPFLVARPVGPRTTLHAAALAMILLSGTSSLLLLWFATRPSQRGPDPGPAGLLHMVLAMVMVIAIVGLHASAAALAVIVGVFCAPLLTHSMTYRSVRWTWGLVRRAWSP